MVVFLVTLSVLVVVAFAASVRRSVKQPRGRHPRRGDGSDGGTWFHHTGSDGHSSDSGGWGGDSGDGGGGGGGGD